MNINKFSLLCSLLLIANSYTIIAMDEEDKIAIEKTIISEKKANKNATFLAIQAMHTITRYYVARNKKKHNNTFFILQNEDDGPIPFNDATQQGLFLSTDDGIYLCRVHTPWGGSKVFMLQGEEEEESQRYDAYLSVFQAFKRAGIKIEFIENTGEKCNDKKIRFYKHDPLQDDLKIEISKKILNQCRGTDTFITTDSYSCNSIYRIISVNKRELPPPIYAPYSSTYDRNLVVDWNLRKSIFEYDRKQIEIQQLYKLTPEKIRILDIVKKIKDFAGAHTPQLAYQAFMLPAEENSQLEAPNSHHIPKENYLKKSCLIS